MITDNKVTKRGILYIVSITSLILNLADTVERYYNVNVKCIFTKHIFIQALLILAHSGRITSFDVSKLPNFKIPAISHTGLFTPNK